MISSSSVKPGEPALRSELATLCLPSSHRDGNQRLAWINSVCLTYLIIGFVGLKPPEPVVRTIAPIEEPIVAVLEPPPVPPPTAETEAADEPEDVTDDLSDAPAVVAVVLDSPEVQFSVPTIGNVLVRDPVSAAPPLKPLQSALENLSKKPVSLAGQLGTRHFPAPQWTARLQQSRAHGTVVLLITVDDSGRVLSIEVKQSTGFPELDEYTVNHVRRRFTFPAGQGETQYELPVEWNNPLVRG